MTLPGRRTLNFVGFAVCAALMAYALYAEHVLMLDPCPLCVFQRIAVIALGLVLLAATLHHPAGRGRTFYAVLAGIVAVCGIAVAGRHIWLQQLPANQVPACGPGLEYILDSFPLSEALRMVFTGSGECATSDWAFLGLSMPAWVLISILVVGGAAVWNNLRTSP